ncbi:hypothetical protein L195_g053684, partial [Trifolium pratense]
MCASQTLKTIDMRLLLVKQSASVGPMQAWSCGSTVVADLACSQAMIWCSRGEMKRFSIKLVQDRRSLIMDDSNVNADTGFMRER